MTRQLCKSTALMLAYNDCDLGDEREVERMLRANGSAPSDIDQHIEAVTEDARRLRSVSRRLVVS